MKKTKFGLGLCTAALVAVCTLAGCGKKSGEDEYDDSGRLILNLKNVYWEGYNGLEDNYTEILNNKFGISVQASNYSYDDWDGDVYTAINGDNIGDVIHFDLRDYNFGAAYETWVDQMIVKQIPDDLSRWPNLQNMISHISNIDKLKIDGHLYGIPVMRDLVNYDKTYSDMIYVYRRDWLEQIDANHKTKTGYEPGYPLTHDNDEYTFEEFQKIMDAFAAEPQGVGTKQCVLVDEYWGFPSVANFYKDAPHCYAKDDSGRAINAFTAPNYLQGLEYGRDLVINKKYYSQDQFNFAANTATGYYKSDQAAIYYDNFSFENYKKLRVEMYPKVLDKIDKATAIMKVKRDDKYSIEGMENWFSMTLFNYDISDNKMEKILSLMDYLLSEEGTRLAIYGEQGYDYDIVDGQIVLSSRGWEKDQYGEYIKKINGAKMLRKMVCLGNETASYDPYTLCDRTHTYETWSKFQNDMKEANEAHKIRYVEEPSDIMWMSAPMKNEETKSMLDDANTYVLKYCFDSIKTQPEYLAKFSSVWGDVLAEINQRLGF